jgi:tetratricopeptide (TPR) repeat protein
VEALRRGQAGDEAYRAACEYLYAGRYHEAIAAYHQAVAEDPEWLSTLAPLVADVLLDELVRPEDARSLLEQALKHAPQDFRVHISYTRVFLALGFIDEALSSANCALTLAPEPDKAIALLQRAAAYALQQDADHALADLASAIIRVPEIRRVIVNEPAFHGIARDPRFRVLLAEKREEAQEATFWSRLWQRLAGQ